MSRGHRSKPPIGRFLQRALAENATLVRFVIVGGLGYAVYQVLLFATYDWSLLWFLPEKDVSARIIFFEHGDVRFLISTLVVAEIAVLAVFGGHSLWTFRDRAMVHLAAALRRAGGDFLADIPHADWALFERERLRQVRVDSMLLLAEGHFTAAAYPAAAEAFQQLLTLDGYLEVAHRGLMRCLARQGEGALAVRHYQGLVELLRADLGTSPSPETILLFERIRRGDDV